MRGRMRAALARTRAALVAALAALPAVAVMAQDPVPRVLRPLGLRAGADTELSIAGENLAGGARLWTSFAAEVEALGDASPGSARFRVRVGAGVPPGIHGLRVLTAAGLSALVPVLVDDLAAIEAAAAAERTLSGPIAIDGRCAPDRFETFRLAARAGETLSIEVLAQRLGSALDPLLVVRDPRGRAAASVEDSGGLGADCRLRFRFEVDGEHRIELRDSAFRGGERSFYRLRIGEFPLPSVAYPLAWDPKSGSTVAFLGEGADAVPPLQPAAPRRPPLPGERLALAARGPEHPASGFAVLELSDVEERAEAEPNDAPSEANPLPLPGAVSGRFARAGDRDGFRIEVKEGERWAFIGQTRALGSPSHLFLRLCREDGGAIAAADIEGAADGEIEHRFKEGGVYLLQVEEACGESGPGHGYRIRAAPRRPAFALSAETDRVFAGGARDFELAVSCERRDYKGAIAIVLADTEAGLTIENASIGEGDESGRVRVRIAADAGAGVRELRLIGEATVDGVRQRAPVGIIAALKKSFPDLEHAPPGLEASIGVGIGAR